jgi:hypothetical protein
MVAAAILGIAATALFGLFSTSLSNLKQVDDLRKYQLAGEAVMNAALLLPVAPPAGVAEGRLQRLNARWTLNVTPWFPANLDSRPPEAIMKFDVQVLWPVRSGERSIALETVKPVSLVYSSYDFQQAVETILPN